MKKVRSVIMSGISAASIVSPNRDYSFIRGIGCDTPETGGISGDLGRYDKPIPNACEERPAQTDLRTGEKVYVDKLLENNPSICYMA